VFLTQEVYATQSKLLKALHLKLTLTQQSQRVTLNAIGFNMNEKEDLTLAGLSFDVLHTLDINEFNNRSTVQLVLKDLQAS
jgi:hypothetical protein